MALRTVTNEALATIWGKPLMVAMEEGEPPKEARVSDMVKALVSNLRGLKGQRLTFNDEEQALLVAQALRASTNGCITFEETPYKWLMELLKAEGPKLFSPNTVMLVKAMEQEVKAPEVTPAGG